MCMNEIGSLQKLTIGQRTRSRISKESGLTMQTQRALKAGSRCRMEDMKVVRAKEGIFSK